MVKQTFLWVFQYFEAWINPLIDKKAAPPRGFFAYCWHFVSQAKLVFVFALIAGGALGVIEILLFQYVGELVDLLSTADADQLYADHALTFFWMAFFVVFIRVGFLVFATILEEQIIVPGFFNRVRWQNHRHIMGQSVSFFHNDFAGRLATQITQSGQSLGDFLISLLQVIWLFLIYVSGSLILFGQLHWNLVAVLFFWCALYTAILTYFIPRIRMSAKRFSELNARLNGRFVDTYSNCALVKLDGYAADEDKSVRAAIHAFCEAIKAYTRNITATRFFLHLINAAMIIGIAGISIFLWQQDAMSIGDVAFALGLVMRLTILATRMLGQFNGLFRAVGTIQNTMETISRPIAVNDASDAYDLKEISGSLTFHKVHFSYDKIGQLRALNGVSFHVDAGERVGIIGQSGAGKTTLFNLALRFYDCERGTIKLDDHVISDVTQHSLRSQFGVVSQETALFNRSIYENIAYARPDASLNAVIEAAVQAQAHEFIRHLHDGAGRTGYDAHVGERGMKLSGGQRQRLALARVILKNAPILLLDEATAALDSETEAAIRHNLERIMDGKTVLAIAHRLSTIAAMDRLIVLDKGRIVEIGKHQDLIEANGLYARLWARQTGSHFFHNETL